MRFKTWPVAAAGFVGLLLLVVVSMQRASRLGDEMYRALDQANASHHSVDTNLRLLRSSIQLSSLFVRDYLLDVSSEHAREYQQRLMEYRTASRETTAELRTLAAAHEERVSGLSTRLAAYWQSFDPLFSWTPAEKVRQSAAFLRREVVPRREAVLTMVSEIEALNEVALAAERADAARRVTDLRRSQRILLWQSAAVGALVSLVAVVRLRSLERRSDGQRAAAEGSALQMRELSQQIVAAQEAERKHLSRELHDQIAQVLTALRMELGRIDRNRVPSNAQVARSVAEALSLVDSMFRSIRDLALGLRPSMLDDFGLEPALEWHVRDFGARSGIAAQLQITGNVDGLPDRHRTCVYRVIQEALTNCARHAQPRSVTIKVARHRASLDVSVADDGLGFDAARRRSGLGLRGIEERVKELGGTMSITTALGLGTTLTFHLPLPEHEEEFERAIAAS